MTTVENEDRMRWWREARFGLFIHWGLYAVPAGTWKGERIPWLGEWIMRRAEIPIPEYEALAKEFDPVHFDAEAWVDLAEQAGMKYLVITAKHHDGFCMFDSPSNPFNIVAATPFKRDPMKALAEACKKRGVRMCFYYSQAQDWHAPGGAGHWDEVKEGKESGKGPYPRPPEDFQTYLDDVVKPNLRELLTNYGPIGLIWFDTPVTINKEQSESLRDLVHELQPDCLVSGRVGHDVGDYGSLGDNQHPAGQVEGDWETPCTLNDTWGFKDYDHNWKSFDELLELLVNCASKGVNYLLNIGPAADGIIPQPSVDLLRQMGAWLKRNGEAVYATAASPYSTDPDWGRMTCKEGALYLMFKEWPTTDFKLYGLRNRVTGVRLLGQESKLGYTQKGDVISLDLPKDGPEPTVSVVALDLDGLPDVDPMPIQGCTGAIHLPMHIAEIDGEIEVDHAGAARDWKTTKVTATWTMRIHTPGQFMVSAVTTGRRQEPKDYGNHVISVTVNGRSVSGSIGAKNIDVNEEASPWQLPVSLVGPLEIDEPGELVLTVRAESIDPESTKGLTLAGVRLSPVPQG